MIGTCVELNVNYNVILAYTTSILQMELGITFSYKALVTSPTQGRGSSTHRVCLSVCLSVTVLVGATGT